MEMTASDAEALVILPQGVLCSDLGKPCRNSARRQGFPSACVSVQACARNIGAALCCKWD